MAKFKDYDEYIEQTEEFAQPLLTFFRECVLEACPAVEEVFKWSMPYFNYNGSNLSFMAGFKSHVTFGFWLGEKMDDPNDIMNRTGNSGMGNFGKMASLDDLPKKEVLLNYIKEAMRLIDEGAKLPSQTSQKHKAILLEVPQSLVNALNQNPSAYHSFNNFSQSNRNEYSQWIGEAKTEKTELKRLHQTMEWLEEGKPKNWKYMKEWK